MLPHDFLSDVEQIPPRLWKYGKVKQMGGTLKFLYEEAGVQTPVIAYLLNLNLRSLRSLIKFYGFKRPDGFVVDPNPFYRRRSRKSRKYRTKARKIEQKLKSAYSPWKKENADWRKMGYE